MHAHKYVCGLCSFCVCCSCVGGTYIAAECREEVLPAFPAAAAAPGGLGTDEGAWWIVKG